MNQNQPDEGEQALAVLRGVWNAQGQNTADLDEACGHTKACKNMKHVGFHGFAGEPSAEEGENAPVGSDLRAAWRARLEREGKLNAESGSVRDLVLGSAEPKQ
jgi:hypothetical protein